ncbi:MAG TPA: hypothetical protein ENK66_10155 [Arcobacter sp.]|nr:hypothetical protein [Arcobacter sp.]
MGKTQRKTNSYLVRYKKKFKRKVQKVIQLLEIGDMEHDLCKLYKEIFPHDFLEMERHYKFYKEKNQRRKKGKPLWFPNPKLLIANISGLKFPIEKNIAPFISRESLKKNLLQEGSKELQKKEEKYKKKNISTQYILPQYILRFISLYWKETNLFKKLYIVKEVSKYKHEKTIIFFKNVLHSEKDWVIKNVVFRAMQTFEEVVFLPPKGKGKGKREQYN